MYKFKTKINAIKDVQNFTKAALRCSGDIDLRQGRYIVNGKSIVGIFSLDLNSEFTVSLEEESDKVNFTAFIKEDN